MKEINRLIILVIYLNRNPDKNYIRQWKKGLLVLKY